MPIYNDDEITAMHLLRRIARAAAQPTGSIDRDDRGWVVLDVAVEVSDAEHDLLARRSVEDALECSASVNERAMDRLAADMAHLRSVVVRAFPHLADHRVHR